MLMLLRQLLAIAILPCTAAVLVPLWLARRRPPPAWPVTPLEMVTVAAGVLLAVAGLALFGWCLRLFWARPRNARPLGSAASSSWLPVLTATSAIR